MFDTSRLSHKSGELVDDAKQYVARLLNFWKPRLPTSEASTILLAPLVLRIEELEERLADHIKFGLGITGPTCPSCGRDNSHHNNVCTAEDCMGVQDRRVLRRH